ncbi:PEP-CTERM putative exosortase interaction domain-containing protein [Opitutaceae bacterium TAV1]|nr:PEP-CTERM putative exosortase interaction domain-containing protein [Opitutaceae bacterium TAV1]
MKFNYRLFLISALLLAGSARLAAQTVVTDLWTDWSPSNHPEWTADKQVNPDAGSTGGGVLHLINGADSLYLYGDFGGGGNNYFYTLFATPTLSVIVSDALAGVNTITFQVFGTMNPEEYGPQNLTLIVNQNTTGDSFVVTPTLEDDNFTWTWDISGIADISTFEITWDMEEHSAFTALQLVQSTSVIPEPSTYAALVSLAILAAVALKRRRRI